MTGAILRNLTESCNHSFGSAFIDTLSNGTEVLWVFGSSWWRPAAAAAAYVRSLGRFSSLFQQQEPHL